MVTALDDAVANVTAALRRTGLYRDSIVVFLSDNGGAERGSNWPLRGKKNSVYEGGTRTVAFVHSPKFIPKATAKSHRDSRSRRGDNRGSRDDGGENNIDNEGKVARGLVHIVDWYPTLLALATNGGCSPNSSNDDGDDYDSNSEDRNNNMPDDGGAVKENDGDVLALPLDGVNQARHLFSGAPAPRTELIYNINDAMRVTAAIRCTAKNR
jgi:arylsulfatase A-like enzyme